MEMPRNLQAVTRKSLNRNTLSTKGKVIDAQYEIFKCADILVGADPQSARDNVDGLFVNPGFTKSQWLTAQ